MIENQKIATSISGVWLQPLQIMATSGGPVMHCLRADYALMPPSFGELYFSEVLPGAIKAWKKHRKQSQLFAVPVGKIEIALYDARQDSPSFAKTESLFLGRPDDYRLLSIPPGIWYGFKGISEIPALICNYADIPHDPEESTRLPLDSDQIPFNWT